MEHVALLIGTSVVRGIGYACVMGVQFAIIGDSVEYGEWKTGVRSEGLCVGNGKSFIVLFWLLCAPPVPGSSRHIPFLRCRESSGGSAAPPQSAAYHA